MTPEDKEWLQQPGQRSVRARLRIVISVALVALVLIGLGFALGWWHPGV
jgi:hypothetical protein